MAEVLFCFLSDKHEMIENSVKYSGFEELIRKWTKRIGKTDRYGGHVGSQTIWKIPKTLHTHIRLHLT
jgi:hypothetical protein